MTGSTTWTGQQRDRERDLLTRLSTLAPDDPNRQAVRDELVTMHLPLVHHLARRYRDRGESYDDLVQVGTEGLIKAVDRFDIDKGVEFSTYATPTIVGEIKRHFRDRTWAMHVPRRMQELQAQVTSRTDTLAVEMGRSPTVHEVATALGISDEDVLDAIEARHAYATDSLDVEERDEAPVAATLGVDEPSFDAIEDRESLRPLIEALPERERRIIAMRFFQGLSQAQIASELGISQMHVSRLLARTLTELREGMLRD